MIISQTDYGDLVEIFSANQDLSICVQAELNDVDFVAQERISNRARNPISVIIHCDIILWIITAIIAE